MTIPERNVFVRIGAYCKKFTFKNEKKALRFMEKQRAKGYVICAYC